MPSYTLFDENWARKEHFHHYYTTNPCAFAFTTILDITGIVGTARKLYPTMLYLITNVANRHKEFRMKTATRHILTEFYRVIRYSIKIPKLFPMCGRNTSTTSTSFAYVTTKIWPSMATTNSSMQNPLRRKTLYLYP